MITDIIPVEYRKSTNTFVFSIPSGESLVNLVQMLIHQYDHSSIIIDLNQLDELSGNEANFVITSIVQVHLGKPDRQIAIVDDGKILQKWLDELNMRWPLYHSVDVALKQIKLLMPKPQ